MIRRGPSCVRVGGYLVDSYSVQVSCDVATMTVEFLTLTSSDVMELSNLLATGELDVEVEYPTGTVEIEKPRPVYTDPPRRVLRVAAKSVSFGGVRLWRSE